MTNASKEARWTKKHGSSFFNYKNHVNADAKHKLIRHMPWVRACTTVGFDGLVNRTKTSADVYADSVPLSAIEAKLQARLAQSHS
jgi:transposase, IS5 family